MAERNNGYVTVNVGLANGNGNGGRGVPMVAGRRLTDAQRREKARRLRRDGWSFRRIAAALGVGYGEVAGLLEDPIRPAAEPLRIAIVPIARIPAEPGAEPAVAAIVEAPPVATAPPAPTAASAHAPASLDELVEDNRALHRKVDGLVSLCEGQRVVLSRLEGTLTSAIQTEHRLLGQKLMASIRALLERMLPASLHFRATGSGNDRN